MVEIFKRNHKSCWTLELECQATSRWHYCFSVRNKSKQYNISFDIPDLEEATLSNAWKYVQGLSFQTVLEMEIDKHKYKHELYIRVRFPATATLGSKTAIYIEIVERTIM